MNTQATTAICLQDITINYVFSFFLGAYCKPPKEEKEKRIVLPWEDESFIKNANSNVKSPTLIEQLTEKIKAMDDNLTVRYHISEEQEPLQNRSALYYKFPHFNIRKKFDNQNISVTDIFPNNQQLTCRLSTHTTFFQTGMGIMWLSVQINRANEISVDDIYHLNQRKQIPYFHLDNEQSFTPHTCCQETVEKLIKQLNEALQESDSIKLKNSVYKNENKLFWKDSTHPSKKNNNGVEICQEPSIFIMLKSNQNNLLRNLVPSILHGVSKDVLDHRHDNDDFEKNLYASNDFFVQVHNNCLLTIHNGEVNFDSPDNINTYTPFMEFSCGIFRTYCAVRGTWHMYNLLNEEVDELLRDLNKKIDENISSVNRAEYTENNIWFRSHFFQYLNSEDPFIRGIGLTSCMDLYGQITKIYRPDLVRITIREKLNDYDKLIDLINNYRYYTTISQKNDKNRFGLYLQICMLLIFSAGGWYFYNTFSLLALFCIVGVIVVVVLLSWKMWKAL